jgi:pimeloyl-ACP methyl ester carboxylesterase
LAAEAGGAPPIPDFFLSLPVPGHPDAFVSLPTGATGKRPVVVVIHGAGDRPDWQCGGWRRATGEYAFVVCPTGRRDAASSTKDDTRFTHANGPALLAYIDASLDALAQRYPEHADTMTPILAGFSLGSFGVLALAVQRPERFPRIALVEGATEVFDDARARTFVQGGGQRVLFGCGQRACEAAAMAAARRLEARDRLPARVVFAPVSHTFDPPLEDAVHGALAWLVEGDARWAGQFPSTP